MERKSNGNLCHTDQYCSGIRAGNPRTYAAEMETRARRSRNSESAIGKVLGSLQNSSQQTYHIFIHWYAAINLESEYDDDGNSDLIVYQ